MYKIYLSTLLTTLCYILSCSNIYSQDQEIYTSLPKGVVVEGIANGVEEIDNIKYDNRNNQFIINNGQSFYKNPISKEEFRELLNALSTHNHIGVSIKTDRSFFTYGDINTNNQVAKSLVTADKILGGVLFAIQEFISGAKLPGNYRPLGVHATKRQILSVATFKFKDYQFIRDDNNFYTRNTFNFIIELIPVHKDRRASDGGYIADGEALRNRRFEPSDIANLNHILEYEQQYLAVPQVDKVVKIGEAAAFIRWLRGGSTGRRGALEGNNRSQMLRDLAAQMR